MYSSTEHSVLFCFCIFSPCVFYIFLDLPIYIYNVAVFFFSGAFRDGCNRSTTGAFSFEKYFVELRHSNAVAKEKCFD